MHPENQFVTVQLREVAHGRTGDKGDRLNVSVFAYHAAVWPHLVEQVTEDFVRAAFAHRNPGRLQRYEVPNLMGLNFVIDDVLEGGVNSGLNLDTHGKTNSFLLLQQPITLPKEVVELARQKWPSRRKAQAARDLATSP